MFQSDFSDDALVLLGHGSTLHPGSAAPVFQHGAELRRRGAFAQVLEGFWKQDPNAVEVLARISARRIFIVPLFISEGYFADDVIPRELGFDPTAGGGFPRVQERGGQKLVYCGPIGSHERMTDVVLSRASEAVEKYPFPRAPKPAETTLFVAGHGTPRNRNSRQAIERQAERVGQKSIYAAVHAVFMEEEPRIRDCHQLAQTRNVVVVPFLISDGLHSIEDIPILLGEPERVVRERVSQGQPGWRNPTERNGKRIWCALSVGTDPGIVEVIEARVREADGSTG